MDNRLEVFTFKTQNDQNIRLIYNPIDNSLRAVVSSDLLKDCKQDKEFNPYIEVNGFKND